MLGLWMVVAGTEDDRAAAWLRRAGAIARGHAATGSLSAAPGDQAPEDGGFLFSRDQPALENAGNAEPAAPSPSPPPWHEEAALARSRAARRRRAERRAAPRQAAAQSAVFLVIAEGTRARPGASDRSIRGRYSVPDRRPPPAAEPAEPPPASFDDAWPKPERARTADAPPPRRGGRTPSTFTEAGAGAAGADRYPPAARNEDQPQVTVLKSGVVDGMAYSLYSDGSIEAQMPEGMMRFASIDELRAHLDQRP